MHSVVVASANGAVGLPAAREVLEAGGSALDAVEAATRLVEDNPDDHTVGYGGWPNLAGEVELDASIMDGTNRKAGAVGALKGIRHPITVARAVMEQLPHVLVVGEGAARFAAEMGYEIEDLLTPEAEQVWRDGLEGKHISDSVGRGMLARVVDLAKDPERVAGTIDVLALDRHGHLASAVSTSGWAWKYPGRLGDSPIIGAGNYCDDRYGAAGCTGWGELAVRASSARTLVRSMAEGSSVTEACRSTIEDLFSLDTDGHAPLMHVVALAPNGTHAAATTMAGAKYVFWEDGMPDWEEADRDVVDPATR